MKSISSTIITILIAVLIVSFIFTPLLGVGAGYLMDYYPGVIERMNQCEKAEELLGENARLSKIGFNYGFAKMEGGYGRVTWRFPVKGDKACGSFKFYMEKHGGIWNMIGGILKSGDREIEIVSCEYYEEPNVPQVR